MACIDVTSERISLKQFSLWPLQCSYPFTTTGVVQYNYLLLLLGMRREANSRSTRKMNERDVPMYTPCTVFVALKKQPIKGDMWWKVSSCKVTIQRTSSMTGDLWLDRWWSLWQNGTMGFEGEIIRLTVIESWSRWIEFPKKSESHLQLYIKTGWHPGSIKFSTEVAICLPRHV